MKLIYILSALLFSAITVNAQKVNWDRLNSLHSDRVLLSGERKPTKVLLLGSFHFGYPNQDAHKTDSSNFIDVLAPDRQKELQELADVIKRFKPTRVYIESSRQKFHDSLYSEFRSDRYKPGRNEIYQVAYRVAGQMGLNKIYTIDAGSFANDNYKKFGWIDSMWNAEGSDPLRDHYWSALYKRYYNAGDSIEKTLTMLENFLLMGETHTLRRMHGAYLTGGFNTKNNDGPDILSMWWYSRNLRIFNNILNTKPGAEDRIIILIGNGHAPILKECFNSSPEFELIELKSLLRM